MRLLSLLGLILFIGSTAYCENLLPPMDKWEPVVSNDKGCSTFQSVEDAKLAAGIRRDGNGQSSWRVSGLKLTPGGTYVLRFKAKGKGSGYLLGRLDGAYVNSVPVSKDWTTCSWALLVPSNAKESTILLDQWELNGEGLFAQPELHPAQVVHSKWDDLVLGKGERISRDGVYIDNPEMSTNPIPAHRTLYKNGALFNNFHWCFGTGSEVIYRHNLPFNMLKAVVSLSLIYHSKGKIVVSASNDGQTWTDIYEGTKNGRSDVPVPEALFPTKQLYIRISGKDGVSDQLQHYSLKADTDYTGVPRTGRTSIIEELTTSPDLSAKWKLSEEGWDIELANKSSTGWPIKVGCVTNGKSKSLGKMILPPKGSSNLHLPKPGLTGLHTSAISISDQGGTIYSAQTEVHATPLNRYDYGYLLDSPIEDISAWWCESSWRVGLTRPSPKARRENTIVLEAAKGEFEPAQVVLRPKQPDVTLNQVIISDLVSKKGRIPASSISLFEVASLNIDTPSDYLGEPGEYPDPLPPLALPLALPQNKNQAIWVLVHIPKNVPGGEYLGKISFKTSHGEIKSNIKLRVFDFSLPTETHLRSALGLSYNMVARYHNPRTDEQKRKLWDLYMRDFADHRISPYEFSPFDPIGVRIQGEGKQRKPVIDFTAYDREAARYLDGLKFTSFKIPIQGLGSGTFAERYNGEFGGEKSGTPEYERLLGDYLSQVEAHLRQKGWLNKGYVYWFDEPAPRDYPFVVEGMNRLKKHAPGLQRLLTEQPENELLGCVDIWCPILSTWNSQAASARRKDGDEMWWYVACERAPYIGEFIEHPANEMRVWPWLSWQQDIQGILIWETAFWTHNVHAPNVQNPWEDPATWIGSGDKPGTEPSYYANGEGRYLYPPRRDPNKPQPPAITPPISSIRWENLRDGMEDYEYLWMLKHQINRVRGKIAPTLLNRAQALIVIPQGICKSPSEYNYDPHPLMERRRAVAEMIQTLQSVK